MPARVTYKRKPVMNASRQGCLWLVVLCPPFLSALRTISGNTAKVRKISRRQPRPDNDPKIEERTHQHPTYHTLIHRSKKLAATGLLKFP